ncbi:MAG: hypothetical protein PVI50_03155 [Gammaproteobacteria bacterium]|jgi:hypothetical protein
MQIPRLLIVYAALTGAAGAPAAEPHWRDGGPPPGPYVENEQLFMFLRLLTPDQMAAFYEARGFPRQAIERIRNTCFVMAHIENRSDRTLWLDLNNWRFETASGEIRRLDTAYWDGVWVEIDMPRANRATFGWTQLPEVRDLQPGEPVGGNVVLPRTDESFTLKADFPTGDNRRKGLVHVSFRDLQCATDTPAP